MGNKKKAKGFDGMFSGSEPVKIEEKKIVKDVVTSMIINKKHLEQVKAIAYWNHTSIKSVIGAFIQEGINKYIEKNGPINDIPEKRETEFKL